MFVVAKQAEQVLGSFEQVAKFQIIVDRRASRDELCLKIELNSESGDTGKLEADIDKKFQEVCRVKPDKIEFLPPGTIPESHKTLEDIRKWE
jgi:phenylacetate-coenzyme A ligase PaaK-like adenylate-forming protein